MYIVSINTVDRMSKTAIKSDAKKLLRPWMLLCQFGLLFSIDFASILLLLVVKLEAKN